MPFLLFVFLKKNMERLFLQIVSDWLQDLMSSAGAALALIGPGTVEQVCDQFFFIN